jgi:phosphatidylserine decarboxylase
VTNSLEPIQFIDGETGALCEEQVYGAGWIRWLYGTAFGRMISALVALPPFSRVYGWLQDRPGSRKKVAPFIEQFDIRMADFLPEEGASGQVPYSSFNAFFTRRVAEGARPFAQDHDFPAPCDARYFAYEALNDQVSVPVKGGLFKATALLGDSEWTSCFEHGPGFIARLCPVDYHRFHYPDDGTTLATWRIPGALHSVNPWALAEREDIFMINERQVSILETEHFGKLAYVEVGATCVGRIVQTHEGMRFSRGDEKGMFLFGGSTVIVIGECGRWQPDGRMLEHTRAGRETYLKMGARLGRAG